MVGQCCDADGRHPLITSSTSRLAQGEFSMHMMHDETKLKPQLLKSSVRRAHEDKLRR